MAKVHLFLILFLLCLPQTHGQNGTAITNQTQPLAITTPSVRPNVAANVTVGATTTPAATTFAGTTAQVMPGVGGSGKRVIWLRNSILVELPITVDVVAGVRCDDAEDICPYERKIGPGSHELTALPVAMEDVRSRADWSLFHDMYLRISDSNGLELNSIEAVATATMDSSSLVIIGTQDSCLYEPGIAAVDNRFILSYRCGGRQQVDTSQDTSSSGAQSTTDYSTFAQLRSSFGDIAHGLIDYIKSYGWERAVLIHYTDNSLASLNDLDAVSKSLTSSGVMLLRTFSIETRQFENVVPASNHPRSKYLDIVTSTFLDTRVYILMSSSPGAPEAAYFAEFMARTGLLATSEYAILVTLPSPFDYLYDGSPNTADVWLNYPLSPYIPYTFARALHPTPSSIYDHYRSAVFITESRPVYDAANWTSFQTRIRAVYKDPPCPMLCNFTITPFGPPYPEGFVSMETGLLYDAITTFVATTNEMIVSNVTDPHKGDVMVQQYGERIVNSITGLDIFVDSFGVPLGNISVLTAMHPRMDLKRGLYSAAQFWLNVTDTGVTWFLHYFYPQQMNWPNGDVPPRRPKCNWKGDGCPSWKDFSTPIAIGGAVFVTVVFSGVLGGFLKQYRNEQHLNSEFWRIFTDDLVLQDVRKHIESMKHMGSATVKSIGSQNSMNIDTRSRVSLGGYERSLLDDIRAKRGKDLDLIAQGKLDPAALPVKKKAIPSVMVVEPKPKSKLPQTPEEKLKAWTEVQDIGVAEFEENTLVLMKRIYKPDLDFTRAVRKELKMLMELKQENISYVVGLIYELPNIFLVFEFNRRGNLKDILENEAIEIDETFRASMVNDVCKAIDYIHHCPMRCHGRLTTINCYVDVTWIIRVGGFAMPELRAAENKELDEEDEARRLVWTAPELLRDAVLREKGTMKGDIYSLGIVLHEIYGRRGPFGDELLGATDIVNQVMNPRPDQALFRPDMSVIENVAAPDYVQLVMLDCWEEEPKRRPNIDKVRKRIFELTKGLKTTVVENVIQMMENYSHKLERKVIYHSNRLAEERKRTERLLTRMLPPSIADQMLTGKSSEPQNYNSCTIYFSDIAGFTSMCNESTADQVVTFLNDLYTCFDAIIASYDVYKVETIGDAYFVIAGVPIRIGDHHAGEITSMSLSLLDAVNHFRIRHRPTDILKLRIGIHSGHCIAGIVGNSMPRFCVFGDTMTKASRMEQSGEALKIHCSAECKEVLEIIGGYEIIERGMTELKEGEPEEVTYWVTEEDLAHRRRRIEEASSEFPSLRKKNYRR